MTTAHPALIPPTANPLLEHALGEKLKRNCATSGSLGVLEALAVRLGLIQNSLAPAIVSPRMVVFAADHGLAVDQVGGGPGHSTAATVQALLAGRLPLSRLADLQGVDLTVVDSGVTEQLEPHARLQARKIAHGTRNSRVGAAMSLAQAHAAMQAGMEIGDASDGSAIACAGLGIGGNESAALVLACLSGRELRDFVITDAAAEPALLAHVLRVLGAARERHADVSDPVETLAAVGGFEIAMMTGLMLAAASRRRVIVVDGLAACAALKVAASIAPSTPDYCLHSRSTPHPGLDQALAVFGVQSLIDAGLDSLDGTGSALAWTLLRGAAALLDDRDEPAGGARMSRSCDTAVERRMPISTAN